MVNAPGRATLERSTHRAAWGRVGHAQGGVGKGWARTGRGGGAAGHARAGVVARRGTHSAGLRIGWPSPLSLLTSYFWAGNAQGGVADRVAFSPLASHLSLPGGQRTGRSGGRLGTHRAGLRRGGARTGPGGGVAGHAQGRVVARRGTHGPGRRRGEEYSLHSAPYTCFCSPVNPLNARRQSIPISRFPLNRILLGAILR